MCCVLENDAWAWENLKLCQSFPELIAGIDIAKNETINPGYTSTEVEVFRQAKLNGIHRTAHAGESGPWTTVKDAMDLLQCQRVGHGYRVFDDSSGECYSQARKQDLHFEVSRYSSPVTHWLPN